MTESAPLLLVCPKYYGRLIDHSGALTDQCMRDVFQQKNMKLTTKCKQWVTRDRGETGSPCIQDILKADTLVDKR